LLGLHVVRAGALHIALLMSVLAIPISLAMAILPGPSGMAFIAPVVLAMLSPVHASIFAEAGVKAKAENRAAVIKILIGTSLKCNQRGAGYRNTHSPANTFPR